MVRDTHTFAMHIHPSIHTFIYSSRNLLFVSSGAHNVYVRLCVLILIAHIFVCALVFGIFIAKSFRIEHGIGCCFGLAIADCPRHIASLLHVFIPFPFHFGITNVSRHFLATRANQTSSFGIFHACEEKRKDSRHTHLARENENLQSKLYLLWCGHIS